MDFLNGIKDRARANKKTIVLPETFDPRTLEAAEKILAEGLANLILIGDQEALCAKNPAIGRATFIDPVKYEKIGEIVEALFELRKSKGMTEQEAKDIITKDPLFLGVMLVKLGLADGMVAGAANATANVLRPALQILKTAPNTKIVSSFFVMVTPAKEYGHDGVFVFSDCGLNQNPDPEELAAIAASSADSFRQLVQAEPVVAMLSHSTKGSAKHADVNKVAEATRIAKENCPDIRLDGELQLDAAIVPDVGKSKAPCSDVAGNANVLIFPDLDAGNIGYKIVERLARARAYGPITQGIAKPVNDLSRGCTADDIVGVVAITAVQTL